MAEVKAIDVHAHILTEETMGVLRKEAPKYRLALRDVGKDFATLDMGSQSYPMFPRGGWDLERRFEDLKKAKFDRQVISVLPQTVAYEEEPELALTMSQVQNEQLLALVKKYPGVFYAVGTVPLQSPEAAATELRRCMTELGMKGIMIGSHVMGRNHDDPALEPVWATAAELGALVFIHPTMTAAGDRLKEYYLKNFIGNPLDTTIAAASMVFAGVFERYPNLKVYLSHGGGFIPYQENRFIHGWGEREEAKKYLKVSPKESLRRLLFDTILHGPGPLKCLVELAGADRIMLGSDYPYDMGQYDSVDMIDAMPISETDKRKILVDNARRLLNIA